MVDSLVFFILVIAITAGRHSGEIQSNFCVSVGEIKGACIKAFIRLFSFCAMIDKTIPLHIKECRLSGPPMEII